MAIPIASQSLRILVVDDDELVRELLEWMLQEAGHRPYLAADGREALRFLERHGPVDVVLSDINMPAMDGMELQRQIHADWPELPLLLTSGRPPPNGIGNFLPKPFRWDALTSAILHLVNQAGRLGRCA
jgi:CheY-like chemotaxis protein